jgi:hypothetical protein
LRNTRHPDDSRQDPEPDLQHHACGGVGRRGQHFRDGGTVISTAFGVSGELSSQRIIIIIIIIAANCRINDNLAGLKRVTGGLAPVSRRTETPGA